jgi:hypothetical protein
MQKIIDLPDELAESLEFYLREHPNESIPSLIQAALEMKWVPKDSAKLLQCAGIITNAPYDAADHAEDQET